MDNTESILTSIKKLLGITEDYTYFDADIIMHINSVLAVLNQLGVGPSKGFLIEDEDAEWKDILGDDARLSLVKSYVHLKVRLLFDPPLSSSVLDAMDRTIKELEWRICAVTDFSETLAEEVKNG